MSDTRWTLEALQARLNVWDALQGQPERSAARAMWRLEYRGIIADVDAGLIPAEVAREQLERLYASMLDRAQLT